MLAKLLHKIEICFFDRFKKRHLQNIRYDSASCVQKAIGRYPREIQLRQSLWITVADQI